MDGMRIERRDDGRATFSARKIDGAPNDSLMAEVESVEIAERNYAAA
jgi:hypothetical protein